MAKAPSRVILDTNLWISFLISSRLIKIDLLLEKGAIRLIFSEESLGEFIEVANRPKFRKFFSEEDIIELLSIIDHFAEIVEVRSEVDICRDSKDNFLLALAKDSKADYLVTGDKELLELESFEGTQIVTFATLEQVLELGLPARPCLAFARHGACTNVVVHFDTNNNRKNDKNKFRKTKRKSDNNFIDNNFDFTRLCKSPTRATK